MRFVHTDRDFQDLVRIVAREREIGPALVEKDYWVTHTLWALHERGLRLWFKGGTSLSKGFGLIDRFSEDLDLMVAPDPARGLPAVGHWTSKSPSRVMERQAFFDALAAFLVIPDVEVERDTSRVDRLARSVDYLAVYPGDLLDELAPALSPFVRLEFGHARVVPCTERRLSSFVHDYLEDHGQLRDFVDNRPSSVHCVHPLVTLFEKLDALDRRYARDEIEADTFVRHYEDAARIVEAIDRLPACDLTPDELATEMKRTKDLRERPSPSMPALCLDDASKRAEIGRAYERIAPMYWGPRIGLGDACAMIQAWLERFVREAR